MWSFMLILQSLYLCLYFSFAHINIDTAANYQIMNKSCASFNYQVSWRWIFTAFFQGLFKQIFTFEGISISNLSSHNITSSAITVTIDLELFGWRAWLAKSSGCFIFSCWHFLAVIGCWLLKQWSHQTETDKIRASKCFYFFYYFFFNASVPVTSWRHYVFTAVCPIVPFL